jgi:hypothetical protein
MRMRPTSVESRSMIPEKGPDFGSLLASMDSPPSEGCGEQGDPALHNTFSVNLDH